MKARSTRWSLLPLIFLMALLIACPARQTSTEPTRPDQSKPLLQTETQTDAETTSQCRRKSPEFYIYVDLAATDPGAAVTPKVAEVCAEQKIVWISSDPSVPIEVFWKRMINPAGAPVPTVLPCQAARPKCGGTPLGLNPRDHVEYGVRAHPPGGPARVFDPELEILP